MPISLASEGGLRAVGLVAVLALSLLPLLGGEVLLFKSGLVLIVVVAALGLHLLVNWAGELSLAHAGMVGLPAFVVLATSSVTGISPVYLLPLGVVVGTAAGALVGLPTLRAKGVQVALVTLVAGFAIDRFFFTQRWLVGKIPRSVADPSLGPIHFSTSRSEYPLLIAVVALALWAASRLHRSKIGRGWLWIRVNPDAAAAFGIPVVGYRVMAYAAAGAFAGLAGALYASWVQSFSSEAFPTTLSFTYLLLAVLAGPGRVWGVVAAVMLVQGAQVFTSEVFGSGIGGTLDTIIAYGGPIGLLSVIIRYQSGLSGMGRKAMDQVRARTGVESSPGGGDRAADEGDDRTRAPAPLALAFVAGVVFLAIGFFAIALAWYHAGNTDAVWVQNQEILSGGVGGLALVVLGSCLLIRDRLSELIPRPTTRSTPSSTVQRAPDAAAVVEPSPDLTAFAPETTDDAGAPKRTRVKRTPVRSAPRGPR
jgi:branched-chain amino acid transport system permease protein